MFARQGDRTELAQRYASSPFGAVKANYPDGSGAPEVQITNPSGGILGGDDLSLEVRLEPGASATVLTQAANKAYRGPEAHGRAAFEAADGATLEYLPHHLIPYADSSYRQSTGFHLAPSATLIAWEACSAGRIARGERFAYARLSSTTRIVRDGRLEVVDGFALRGKQGGEPFGGYSYLGAAAYVLAPRSLEPLAEKLHAALSRMPRALASASAPASGVCTVRVLTSDATALYRALNACRAVARLHLGLSPAAREVW